MSQPQRKQKAAESVDKSELVLAAIRLGLPSYEAWALSEQDLTTFIDKNTTEV